MERAATASHEGVPGADTLAWAAHSFRVDLITAEVTQALEAASIPSILLKGPGIATWLYASGQPRLYGDTDLLLRREDWERAMDELKRLGFEDELAPLAHPRMESGDGYPWGRPADRAAVDLHYTLFGIGSDPDAVWAAFERTAESLSVGGTEALLPSQPARLLHIALHAVQHGGDPDTKPTQDLRQGLANAPVECWREAAALARELDAIDVFAAGLQLFPEGRQLAAALEVEASRSDAANLRTGWVPLAEGFQELAEADGIAAKLRIAWREAFPTPTFMRWWLPLAKRGRLGLALAYLWRPLWLAYRAVPGYRAWRRARANGASS